MDHIIFFTREEGVGLVSNEKINRKVEKDLKFLWDNKDEGVEAKSKVPGIHETPVIEFRSRHISQKGMEIIQEDKLFLADKK